MARQTSSVGSLACRAPVGQRLMHWPQLMQTTSASGLSRKVETVVRSPRSTASSTPTSCRSMQVRTQRRQRMHLFMSRTTEYEELSTRASGLVGVAEAEEVDAVLRRQRLQLAVVVALAGVALAVVRARAAGRARAPARLADLARVGVDLDRRRDRVGARRLQRPLALDLDHAHPAHAGHAQVLVVAERRDADAELLGGVEDRGAERHRDRPGRRSSTRPVRPMASLRRPAPSRGGRVWLTGARRGLNVGLLLDPIMLDSIRLTASGRACGP